MHAIVPHQTPRIDAHHFQMFFGTNLLADAIISAVGTTMPAQECVGRARHILMKLPLPIIIFERSIMMMMIMMIIQRTLVLAVMVDANLSEPEGSSIISSKWQTKQFLIKQFFQSLPFYGLLQIVSDHFVNCFSLFPSRIDKLVCCHWLTMSSSSIAADRSSATR